MLSAFLTMQQSLWRNEAGSVIKMLNEYGFSACYAHEEQVSQGCLHDLESQREEVGPPYRSRHRMRAILLNDLLQFTSYWSLASGITMPRH